MWKLGGRRQAKVGRAGELGLLALDCTYITRFFKYVCIIYYEYMFLYTYSYLHNIIYIINYNTVATVVPNIVGLNTFSVSI